MPELLVDNEEPFRIEGEDEQKQVVPSEDLSSNRMATEERVESPCTSGAAEIKLVRIQGIQPKLEIPFSWVVNNLKNPEYFLHICVYLKFPRVISFDR